MLVKMTEQGVLPHKLGGTDQTLEVGLADGLLQHQLLHYIANSILCFSYLLPSFNLRFYARGASCSSGFRRRRGRRSRRGIVVGVPPVLVVRQHLSRPAGIGTVFALVLRGGPVLGLMRQSLVAPGSREFTD